MLPRNWRRMPQIDVHQIERAEVPHARRRHGAADLIGHGTHPAAAGNQPGHAALPLPAGVREAEELRRHRCSMPRPFRDMASSPSATSLRWQCSGVDSLHRRQAPSSSSRRSKRA